ncbi:hypothetical protein PV377_21220 [Streptomyces ipomoeae]|uniref:DUF6248 family natural product biosynthesis protein n=1 Tax=Streptomyces ipomoeae TaxID=103232 RepID=UPI0029B4C117|nr:DUF6248 family natural product biosynthesis protein [Streptomyces ipomoeae]MDX2841462.1 hypothetical protein [Streptomyces ipomoeae]
MNPADAEWIRTHVWPTELTKTWYQHEHICTCERPCPCEKGQHHYCLTPDGTPIVAVRLAIVYGSRYTGRRLLSRGNLYRQRRADVVHLPHQRPCRTLCRCDHKRPGVVPTVADQKAPTPAPAPRRTRTVPITAGQIGLFEEAAQ